MSDDLCYTPAVELRRMIATKEVSAVEVTQAVLERLEAVNPRLNAIVAVRAEAALEEARSADETNSADRGLVLGIPFTVKDVTETMDLPTTIGSQALGGYVAGYEAVVVTRLREAGGILVGKTNTPEFGLRPTTENRVYGKDTESMEPGTYPRRFQWGSCRGDRCGVLAPGTGSRWWWVD